MHPRRLLSRSVDARAYHVGQDRFVVAPDAMGGWPPVLKINGSLDNPATADEARWYIGGRNSSKIARFRIE